MVVQFVKLCRWQHGNVVFILRPGKNYFYDLPDGVAKMAIDAGMATRRYLSAHVINLKALVAA